jgi:hypothetical protein
MILFIHFISQFSFKVCIKFEIVEAYQNWMNKIHFGPR